MKVHHKTGNFKFNKMNLMHPGTGNPSIVFPPFLKLFQDQYLKGRYVTAG
jgi:hypothetical protein